MNNDRYIYALGFFDGVHLGHQALLSAAKALAREHRCTPGAVTFGIHPETLVRGRAPGLINTPDDRVRLLRRFGMDRVEVLPFDQRMQTMAWEDFLTLLCRDHAAAGFVCGADFRFGFRGEGNARLLEAYCRDRGLLFFRVEDRFLEGKRISSTLIRELLAAGDMEKANAFLGHDHMLTGTVVPGKQLGRRLGFPTANLRFGELLAPPKFGVYACRCLVEGKSYPAVTNIGVRPTVSGTGITVEPWILDYEGDLYGREITLFFRKFLREEKKFPDLDALAAQIRADAAQTRQHIPL